MALTLNATPHEAQAEVHNSDARFRVLAAGRRFGKTRLGVFESMEQAFHPAGRRAWWISPSYKMATVGWRPISRIAHSIPGATIKQSERLVEFPTGGSIQVRSADDPDSLRGEGLDYVCIDEAGFVNERAWSEAIRPALSDRKGKALIISTPKGKNWFFNSYQKGLQDEEWESFAYPTSSNPHIDKAEIEQAQKDLPDMIYQQEYEAKFLDDAGGVFRKVMSAVTDQEPQTGRYVMGVDWGRSHDATVMVIVNIDTGEVVEVMRLVKVDYQTQVNNLVALHERYPGDIIAEQNAMGAPIVETLANQGLPIIGFTTTSQSKQKIIDGLALAFEQELIAIPNDPVLIGELQAFQAKRLASGRLQYSAPIGLHDDCVMALALAWSGKESSEPMVLLSI